MDLMALLSEPDEHRIPELESKIKAAREAYYNGTPTVSDDQYDAWVDELRELAPSSPEVTSVGAPVPTASEWKKAEHGFVMGSLDKVNTPEELAAWRKGVGSLDQPLFVTEKLDGVGIHIRYSRGKYEQAITRGDGKVGEDITLNAIQMKGVPTTLSGFSGSLRGEIVLLKSDHAEYFPDYANPRNAASGISKRYDGKGCEHLSVFFYQVVDGWDFATESEQLLWLTRKGLQVPEWSVVENPVDVWAHYQQGHRDTLDYDIDGLVVRVEDLAKQTSLGDKDGRPRGAVAFKFAPAAKETTLRRIDWQVGGTGRLTPVGHFDPVNLMGATVSQASLYNQKYILEIGANLGSRVLVARANDVIPRIMSVVSREGGDVVFPSTCPCCEADVVKEGEYLVCPNTAECPAQAVGRIKRYIHTLDVKEWGDTLIERLVESGKVKTPADLYRLDVGHLTEIDRVSEHVAHKLRNLLWEKVELPIELLLGALSIPLCATQTIQMVTDAGHDSWAAIQAAELAALQAIPGLGPIKAEALYRWTHGTGDRVVSDLLRAGVRIKEKIKGKLTGKTFCFTGTMQRKRSELLGLVVQHGGVVKSNVAKGLTYLVIADPTSDSSKAVNARKLGTTCISEENFLAMVGA